MNVVLIYNLKRYETDIPVFQCTRAGARRSRELLLTSKLDGHVAVFVTTITASPGVADFVFAKEIDGQCTHVGLVFVED